MKNRKTIGIYVLHFDEKSLFAIQRQIYDLVTTDFDHDYRVYTALTGEASSSSLRKGATVVRKETRSALFRKIVDDILKGELAAFHYHGRMSGLVSLYWFLRRVRIPVFLSLYNLKINPLDLLRLKWRDWWLERKLISAFVLPNILLPKFFLRFLLGRIGPERLIVPSQRLQRFYNPLVRCPIDVVPLGVDGRRFRKREKNSALLNELGLKDSDRVLLHFGHLRITRGILDLIEAFPLIKERNPELKFLVVLNDKWYGRSKNFAVVKKFIARVPPEVRRDIILKVENVASPSDYYNVASVVCSLYNFELELPQFPLVLIESILCGTPVVTTDLKPLDEIVNESSGVLVPASKDAAALVEGIDTVLKGCPSEASLSESRRCLVEKFSKKRDLEYYVGLYR